MKTFPLGAPPPHAGIYLIRHIPTQKVYFGKTNDLKRRFLEWRTGANTGTRLGSIKLRDMMLTTDLTEWEFCILEELPGADDSKLRTYELRAIDAATRKCRDRLLNTVGTGEGGDAERKTKLTYEGKPILQTEAAKILGVSPKSLAKRLAKRRAKGEFEVKLEALIELSRAYWEQKAYWAQQDTTPKNPPATNPLPEKSQNQKSPM